MYVIHLESGGKKIFELKFLSKQSYNKSQGEG